MRIKIITRSQKNPFPFLLRLADGKLVRDTLNWVNHKVMSGDTGTIVQSNGRQRLKADAIDLEYVSLDK
jgi:hypothetical protein